MSDEVQKPLHLNSQTVKIKPSCSFSREVQKLQKLLAICRSEVILQELSSIQDSLELQKTLQAALLEFDVEVVSVSGNEDLAIEYLKSKNNANAIVVAYVRLEVERGDRYLQFTSNCRRLLERDYPCEILFDIKEMGDISEENFAEKFSEFTPVAIIKQRSEIINAWLEKYQEAIGTVISKRKKTNKKPETFNISMHSNEDVLQNMATQGNKEVVDYEASLQRQSPDETVGETIFRIINKLIDGIGSIRQELFYTKEQCDCDLCVSIIKIIIRRCKKTHLGRKCTDAICALLSIFQLKEEEIKENRTFIHALEEEIKIVQNLQLPFPDDFEIRRRQRCQLISFCCGLVDSKRGSVGFGFRAESFDRIHVSISRSIDASIDRKTIREATQETRTVDGYIEEKNLKMTREDRKRLFKLVNKYSEELMEKHSNLNRISVSPVISHRHGSIEETPCIVMYCSCKGIRPGDEPEFRRQIENVPVDVREGYCSLFGVSEAKDYNDPLRTGISIGSHGMKDSGTLGPFAVEAENKTSVGFLTCQHVFQSAEIGINVVQPSVIHYKADTNPDTTICGKIKSMCLEDVTFNRKPTTMDVAFVVLDKRIPDDFRFPDIPESMITEDFYGNPRMGEPIIHLKEDSKDSRVYKLGQASGLTEGVFDTMPDTVVLDKERVRNVYQVSSNNIFADHGDSGSSVFIAKENTLSVIGVLLGGSENGKECYVIPIGAVLEALKPKLEIYQFKGETTTGAEGSNDDHQSDDTSGPLSGAEAVCIHGQSSSDTYPYISQSVKAISCKK